MTEELVAAGLPAEPEVQELGVGVLDRQPTKGSTRGR
jgi:hypothetical protein